MYKKVLKDSFYGEVEYAIDMSTDGVGIEWDNYDGAPPTGYIPYECLDDTIVVLSAIRNAKLLGIEIKQLYKYEPGIGGGFYVGTVSESKARPDHANVSVLTILYMANVIHYEGKFIYHNYGTHIGDRIRAGNDYLEVFPPPTTVSEHIKLAMEFHHKEE